VESLTRRSHRSKIQLRLAATTSVFAFVEFADAASALRALQLNGMALYGSTIRVGASSLLSLLSATLLC
jgi:hypothetical protein